MPRGEDRGFPGAVSGAVTGGTPMLDRLRAAGREILDQDKEYQKLIEELGGG